MMSQEGLIYVDKQYKHDMQTYESIKGMTSRVVTENTPLKDLVKNWKLNVR